MRSLAANYEDTKSQFANFGFTKDNGVDITKGWVPDSLAATLEDV